MDLTSLGSSRLLIQFTTGPLRKSVNLPCHLCLPCFHLHLLLRSCFIFQLLLQDDYYTHHLKDKETYTAIVTYGLNLMGILVRDR